MKNITGIHYVEIDPNAPYVILDRIVTENDEPAYCIHGRMQCAGCGHWVWLGNNSHAEAMAGRVRPLCNICALTAHLDRVVANVNDHQRKDGPHG